MSDVKETLRVPVSVLLHLGAHRTGSTSFQKFLAINAARLDRQGIAVLTPPDTRPGPIGADRLAGPRLIVSEENLIGTMEECLRARALYPEALAEMRKHPALIDHVETVYLSVRSYAAWWNSVVTYSLRAGASLPDDAAIARMSDAARRWPETVADIRTTFPQARILVREFFWRTGSPLLQLQKLTNWVDIDALEPLKGVHNHRPRVSRLLANGRLDGTDARVARFIEGDQLQIFCADRVRRMNDAYMQDLDQIARMEGVEVLIAPKKLHDSLYG